MTSVLVSCTSAPPATVFQPPPPEPEVVEISIVVSPKSKEAVPEGTRLVISDLEGDCANEVRDALMRRLIDNERYEVLTRENLNQILGEAELKWSGGFDTTTGARLNELLAASMFIVGRVAYCGDSAKDTRDNEEEASELTILAILQILDLTTGKVLVSSASEGKYVPRPAPALFSVDKAHGSELEEGGGDSPEVAASTTAHTTQPPPQTTAPAATQPPTAPPAGGGQNILKRLVTGLSDGRKNASMPSKVGSTRDGLLAHVRHGLELEPLTFARLRAAEDLANSFADKFFARPMWEKVEMWNNPSWKYSDSIRFVKLGNCPAAAQLMMEEAAEELPRMNELEVAAYLHNYGVALLCSNKTELAMKKLRSAYRANYNLSTLRMLGLAAKIIEWNLDVEVDRQPEVEMLLKR
jgi:hypothetical protein